MGNLHDKPEDERVYAKVRRPYEFGSFDLVAGGFKVSPARVESPYPNMFREAIYPDGTTSIQGAYAWSQGDDGGVIWRDLPQVYVDTHGQEIPKE